VWGFGREIALLGFNAVQQLGVDIDCDQFWSVPTAAVAVMCTLAIALPNRTTFPLLGKRV
jgi:hypothetical protein